MQTNLLFGIHCHQPIDNFDEVVYDAIAKSYKPFFETLSLFPHFKCSVHFSGWLLEFIQKNDAALFSLMQKLANQIEFFSGGYYEPILASIPSKDRIAQIKKLNTFIKTYFGQTPSGLWLTERVWDDSIIYDLVACNIEYVIVDDYHLIANGTTSNLNGYYLTENNGVKIAIFPISKTLRYAIPFSSIDAIQSTLHSFSNHDGYNGAIIFDDGEKFGIWPNTYDFCYEQGWLKDFFALCQPTNHIQSQTYKEFFLANKPLGLVYLPTASYEEMGHWSNLGGENPNSKGIWKNFFIKYPESNHIHKRILELSQYQIENVAFYEALYKAQCNDVLWHGVFGGIYLPNLRDNAYKYIIECENMLPLQPLQIVDLNFDGYDEFKFSSNAIVMIVAPKSAAQIVEFDIKDKNFNLNNTLTRRSEPYHQHIQYDKHNEHNEPSTIHANILTLDNSQAIYIDRYKKNSAIDHISNESFNFETFKANTFDLLVNLHDTPWNTKDNNSFVYTSDELTITKEYNLENNIAKLSTKGIYNNTEPHLYIQEWNLHFAMYDILKINNYSFDGECVLQNCTKLEIFDPYLQKTLLFTFSRQIDIFLCHNYTVSQSETGLDLTIQHLSMAFSYRFTHTFDLHIQLSIL